MFLYNILGPAAIPTLVCLGIGLVLLLIELFTPGVGVAGFSGVACLVAVIVMQLLWGSATAAFYIAGGVMVIVVIALILFIHSLQKGRLSRSFIVLNDTISADSTPTAGSQALVGVEGVALTALRPSGIALLDGKRLDVMTSGDFIDKGTPLRVTQVEGLHILVEECSK